MIEATRDGDHISVKYNPAVTEPREADNAAFDLLDDDEYLSKVSGFMIAGVHYALYNAHR